MKYDTSEQVKEITFLKKIILLPYLIFYFRSYDDKEEKREQNEKKLIQKGVYGEKI